MNPAHVSRPRALRSVTPWVCSLAMIAFADNYVEAQNPEQTQSATIDCREKLTATDTIAAVVKISVTATKPDVRLPGDFENLFAQEFRSYFAPPKTLPLRVVKGQEPCGDYQCPAAVLTVDDVAYATAHPDGTLSDISFVDGTFTPELVEATNAALQKLSDERDVPLLAAGIDVEITIRLNAEEKPDTVPPVRHLFKSRLPRYNASFDYPRMVSRESRPRYPRAAEARGVNDLVEAAFTVEPDGIIPKTSIQFLKGRPEFISSVWEAFERAPYQPGYIGACAVAARVKGGFQFKAYR